MSIIPLLSYRISLVSLSPPFSSISIGETYMNKLTHWSKLHIPTGKF